MANGSKNRKQYMAVMAAGAGGPLAASVTAGPGRLHVYALP